MALLDDIRISARPALAFAAMGVAWAALSAQVPVLKAAIGASDSQFGIVFLLSSIGAMSAMWLAPRVDRLFGSASLAVSTAALGLALVLPGVAGTIAGFTAALFMMAMASGVMDVLMNARISEMESRARRPLMNLNHAIFSFAYAGAALLTGLAREAGWTPVWVFGVICALILLTAPLMRSAHAVLSDAPPPTADARGLGLIVWLGGLVVLAAFFTEAAVEGWSALHLERTLGGAAAQGAMGPAVLGLTMGIGRMFGQALIRRLSDTTMIAGACLISAIGMAIAGFAPGLMVAYFGFGLTGLGVSVLVPLSMALVGRAVPEHRRVAAIGQASIIGYGAFFLGPLAMGVTADIYGLPSAFLLVSATLLTVAVLLVPLIARQSPAPLS